MDEIAHIKETDGATRRFAERLHDELGVERILLYGAFKRDFASSGCEYRIILVSSHFEGVDELDRPLGVHDVFYEAGGDAALNLTCLTPDEFDQAKRRASLVRAVLPAAIDLLAEEPATT
jgi:hypothetical protein